MGKSAAGRKQRASGRREQVLATRRRFKDMEQEIAAKQAVRVEAASKVVRAIMGDEN